MNLEIALRLYTLGARYGAKQSKLGMEPEQMTDERLGQILHQGFIQDMDRIERMAKQLNAQEQMRNWYAENWTCQQAFRFGVIAGFKFYPDAPTKRGEKILVEDVIDKFTQEHFKQSTEFGDGA